MVYEEVFSDLESESRRLIGFRGLDGEPACLDFHRRDGRLSPPALGRCVNPLYRHSLGCWRRYARHLSPLLVVASERAATA